VHLGCQYLETRDTSLIKGEDGPFMRKLARFGYGEFFHNRDPYSSACLRRVVLGESLGGKIILSQTGKVSTAHYAVANFSVTQCNGTKQRVKQVETFLSGEFALC
jgi:hypothetical protein